MQEIHNLDKNSSQELGMKNALPPPPPPPPPPNNNLSTRAMVTLNINGHCRSPTKTCSTDTYWSSQTRQHHSRLAQVSLELVLIAMIARVPYQNQFKRHLGICPIPFSSDLYPVETSVEISNEQALGMFHYPLIRVDVGPGQSRMSVDESCNSRSCLVDRQLPCTTLKRVFATRTIISSQLSCNSCSRLNGTHAWELRKLSCKLSLLNSHWESLINSHQLSCNSCSRLNGTHESWENSHANRENSHANTQLSSTLM